jgi:hypothetical protein
MKKYEVSYVRELKPGGVELYLPKFSIRAINTENGKSSATLFGYIDTGNDLVTLPLSVAQSIGVDLQVAKTVSVLGAGGRDEMPTHDVTIECFFGQDNFRFSCTVSFSKHLDSYTPLTGYLGNSGFINKFERVILYPKEKRMELFI